MFINELIVKDYPASKICLIKPDLTYAAASLAWISDTEVGQYMGADFSDVSLETEKDRITDQLANPDLLSWMIEFDGVVIGNIEINGVKEASEEEGKKAGKFSTIIGDKTYWGRRISPAVKNAVMKWAFTDGGFEILIGRARTENIRSWRSMEHAGFTFRSLQADTYNGQPIEWKVYAMTKAHFSALQNEVS